VPVILCQTQHSTFCTVWSFQAAAFDTFAVEHTAQCTEHIAMHTYKKLKAASSNHQRTELHRQWGCHTVCTVHAANRLCACCKHTVCRLQTHSACRRHTVPAANILCMLQTYCACCRHTLTAASTLQTYCACCKHTLTAAGTLQTYRACCKHTVHAADTL